eukprot:CAMPEP_0196780942 /NCGR_PEP_ID=MMETSP1104-20130614/8871_1 /TAXON_ID=33652 /ORGANISM="Cafeteria sp., Strain Caron Lab Isolate" /LENGTH=117 /DNA_ID=CAMNT_0042151159 /DNA_START=14 /DNA_END=367 /DNA_ORIENTATION=-
MSSEAKFHMDATSQVAEDTLAAFLTAPVESDLSSLPGVGPAAIRKFKAAGVETTHQLIGVYLSMKGEGVSVQAHCDAFWEWLQEVGINAHRSGIVLCIAEKVNSWMPGIFDSSAVAK